MQVLVGIAKMSGLYCCKKKKKALSSAMNCPLFTLFTVHFKTYRPEHSVYPEQMLQNAVFDQGLHCLPFI